MEVINEVTPSDPRQIEEMARPGPKGPVFMVNLLKFKDKAVYSDGRSTTLTGREAYQIYGNSVAALLPQFGGQIFFMADVTWLQLGQVEELWHEVAIAVYPSREALFKMSSSQEWADISVHREAGLAGQLNMESVMPEPLQALPWIESLMNSMKA